MKNVVTNVVTKEEAVLFGEKKSLVGVDRPGESDWEPESSGASPESGHRASG